MKIAVLSGLGLAALVSASALAADMPATPPVYRVVDAVWCWTGPYLGGNAGETWARSDIGVAPSQRWLSSGVASDAAGAAINFNDGPDRLSSSGFTGGLQAGVNVQRGAAVYGLEADIDYAGLQKSLSRGPFVNAVNGVNVSFNESTQTSWLGTFRGRLGYLVTPRVLLFATGGFAFGDRSFSDSRTAPTTIQTYAGSVSGTKAGSTVGGGLEAYLGSNWTAKAEYLYVDLGHVTAIGLAIAPVNPLYSISYTEHLTENIVRLGVNYHFSGLAGLSY
jgi:outer membrane immunogenic protein